MPPDHLRHKTTVEEVIIVLFSVCFAFSVSAKLGNVYNTFKFTLH